MHPYRKALTVEKTRQEITQEILTLLAQLASDWDYEGAIGVETYLFTDLGFQSLDAVVLGNSLQERFGQPIPYATLLATIGQQQFQDITVGAWIDFTVEHLQSGATA